MLIEQCQKIRIDEVVRQAVRQSKQSLISSGIQISDHSVQLTTTKTQFGGQRTWFICPACQQRCGVLLQHPLSNEIGCRRCLDLDYRKQRYKGMIEAEQNTSAP